MTQDAPLMVTLSGIRGIAGVSLTPKVISKYVEGFVRLIHTYPLEKRETSKTIVVGTDSRTSRDWVLNVVSATLNSMGINVYTLGIVPTPTVQYTVIQGNFAGGIVVTSSHNPSEWNGLKFVDSDGLFVTPERTQQMFDIADGKEEAIHPQPPSYDGFGWTKRLYFNALETHIKAILRLSVFSDYFSTSTMKEHPNLRIACDTTCGAGGPALRRLLQSLPFVEFRILNEDTTGDFPHNPEPTPANLADLAKMMENGMDFNIGVAVDPDVDRCVIAGKDGILSEELTLAMATDFLLAHGLQTPCIVKNMSTSLYTDKAAAIHNVPVVESPVGEACVARKMMETGAELGGEGNGGVMFKQLHIGRDAPLAAACVIAWYLWRLREENYENPPPIDQLVKSRFGDVYTHKSKMALPAKERFSDKHLNTITSGENIKLLGKNLCELVTSTDDGLKIKSGLSWWIHIRASNTEPIMRVIYESSEGGDHLDQLISEGTDFLQEHFLF